VNPNAIARSLQPNAARLWVIGGSDTRGGAGIQADLQTATDFGVCCHTIVSAVTAQSSQSVTLVNPVSAEHLLKQLNTSLQDGLPQAIKIGLLVTQKQVDVLAEWLKDHSVPIVLDPVQIASTGNSLINESVNLSGLYPFCTLVTPNLDECEQAGGIDAFRQCGVPAILVTGQRLSETERIFEQLHVFGENSESRWVHSLVETKNTHGTGCTLSSAIAARMASGSDLRDAITAAIAYVQHGLQPDAVASARQSVGHRGFPSNPDLWPMVPVKDSSIGELQFPELAHPLGFYPVVNTIEWVEKLLQHGVRTLQLRVKDKTNKTLREDLAQAIALAKSVNAQLFINDHWELACELGAYGIHLGQEDMQDADLQAIADCGLRLGLSTHNLFELGIAFGVRPSYYALGHIFSTTTKQMPGKPQGLHRLAEQARLLRHRPTVAIGGINRSNAERILATGVSGLAVVRAVTESVNLGGTIEQFAEIFERFGLDANIKREVDHADID